MGILKLVPGDSQTRHGLVLGIKTHLSAPDQHARLPLRPSIRSGSLLRRCHPERQTPQVRCEAVQRSEKGLQQGESDPRPLPPQQVHPQSLLQNDDYCRRHVSFAQGQFHSFDRYKGRLLAYPNSQALPKIPRFQGELPDLHLSSPPLRSHHSPQDLHQNNDFGGEPPTTGRGMFSGIPRRPPHLVPVERVPLVRPVEIPQLPSSHRLEDQLEKVQFDPLSTVHLSRPRMGHRLPLSLRPPGQEEELLSEGSFPPFPPQSYPKTAPVSRGQPKLCLPSLTPPQGQIEGPLSPHKQAFQTLSSQGDPPRAQNLHQGMLQALKGIRSKTHVLPPGLLDRLYRRISVRLGLSLRQGNQKRSMAPEHDVLPHQRPRINHYSPSCKTPQSPKRLAHPRDVRQYNCSQHNKKGRIPVSSSEQDHVLHSRDNPIQRSFSLRKSHPRLHEHRGRQTLSSRSHSHRMDLRSGRQSSRPVPGTPSSGRPICHLRKQGPRLLHQPCLSSPSRLRRCLHRKLVPLERDLSVSPNEPNSESSSGTENLQRHLLPHRSTLAQQTMVRRTEPKGPVEHKTQLLHSSIYPRRTGLRSQHPPGEPLPLDNKLISPNSAEPPAVVNPSSKDLLVPSATSPSTQVIEDSAVLFSEHTDVYTTQHTTVESATHHETPHKTIKTTRHATLHAARHTAQKATLNTAMHATQNASNATQHTALHATLNTTQKATQITPNATLYAAQHEAQNAINAAQHTTCNTTLNATLHATQYAAQNATNATLYAAQHTTSNTAQNTTLHAAQQVPNTAGHTSTQPSCPGPSSPLQLLTSCSQTRTQFISLCLQRKGIKDYNSKYFVSSVRSSTQNQYEHVWKTFGNFCHSHNFSRVNNDLIISFFDHLIRVKGLRVKTLLSYRSALIDPLIHGFDYDITNDIISKSLRGMSNLNPEPRYRAPDWSLDLVLQYILDNKDNKSLLFMTRKTLFLVGLALGSRVSELFSLMRDDGSLSRLSDGSFEIYQDPQFLAKNEDPLNRRGPVIIKPLLNNSDTLCPCKSLSEYLTLTKHTKSSQLFVHPTHLGKWGIASMRLAIVRLIKASQPQSLARAHDLRKVASSLAFYSKMSINKINQKMGWKSRSIFRRFYLLRIKELQVACSSL